jgi:hypothetical protein
MRIYLPTRSFEPVRYLWSNGWRVSFGSKICGVRFLRYSKPHLTHKLSFSILLKNSARIERLMWAWARVFSLLVVAMIAGQIIPVIL